LIVFFSSDVDHRDLHSFPTRRSSDLEYGQWLSEFYKFVASSRQPRYDLVTAQVRDQDERDSPRRTVCYERLLLPWKTPSNEVLRSEEHTSELQSLAYLVCRLLLEKKK